MQAESSVNGTNELQQAPTPSTLTTTTTTATAPNCSSISTSPTTTATINRFMHMQTNPENNITAGELDEYYYGQEEGEEEEGESCFESDLDEDLFDKVRQSRGSLGLKTGTRHPLDDIDDSSNALQIHDNHGHGLSLHNRHSNGEGCSSGGVSQTSGFLNLSPPVGSALPGTMFRLRFIGSLEIDEEIGSGKRRRKRPKKSMVEEAVTKLKVGGMLLSNSRLYMYLLNVAMFYICIPTSFP